MANFSNEASNPMTVINIQQQVAQATNFYYEYYLRQGQLNLRSIPAA